MSENNDNQSVSDDIVIFTFPSDDGAEYDFIAIPPSNINQRDAFLLAGAVIKDVNRAFDDAAENNEQNPDGHESIKAAIQAKLIEIGFFVQNDKLHIRQTTFFDAPSDMRADEQAALDAWNAKAAMKKAMSTGPR